MAERREWGSVDARKGGSTRLDPDVLEAVAARVARGEGSRAKVVNDQLRQALGLVKQSQPGAHQEAHQRSASGRPPVSLGRPNGSTSRRGALGTARTSSATPNRCPHPPGRRLGDRCAACGATVRSTR